MKRLAPVVMLLIAVAGIASAAERMPIGEVDTDAFSSDTQVLPKGAGDQHLALAWWIPNEFWESVLTRDATTSEADKNAMLDAMSGVSLLAIVQADISPLGAFSFYSQEQVEKHMKLSFSDPDGKTVPLSLVQELTPDLEIVLGVFKPILGAAMGNLGNNMHFFVLEDTSKASSRILDPYREGQIGIRLSRRDGFVMDAEIEMPINALFVPRKCPNGKDAHVSWKFCPWTGTQLAD